MTRFLVLFSLALIASTNRLPADHFFGDAEASTAVPVGNDFMFVANDENELIHLYKRDGGQALRSFDFSKELRAKKHSKDEVDLEASTRIGNRIYWLGSHSNKKGDGKFRPNRHRLFATDLLGETNLVYAGRYDSLRSDLIEWDKRTSRLGLEQAASIGIPPDEAGGKGFNIEGLSVAPDGRTAWVGFRAPLVLTNGRPHALLVPVLNLPNLIESHPSRAEFGPAVLLDLGGRGIRSIETFTNRVLIVAGPAANDGDFRLFVWDGDSNHQPTRCDATLGHVGSERKLRPEAIVGFIGSDNAGNPELQLLSDDGKQDIGFAGFRSFNVPVCPVKTKKH